MYSIYNIIRCIAVATMLVVSTAAVQAQQKKKTPLQKRENYEFTFDLPRYVEQLKKELTYPLAWGNSGIKDFAEWKTAARAKVLECMMTPPKQAESYDCQVIGEERRDGYTARKILFNVNAYSRITAYLLIPDGKGPFPAVNMLHDHGGHLYIGKEKMVRPFDVDTAVVNDADRWVEKLYDGQYAGDYFARNGYVVFSADAPMWGERGREEGVDRSKYDIICGNMMMLGRDLSAFMTYDDITGTEFLASLPEVDKSRIGCMGCSMGAYRAWMLAALSDKIAAAASICWMTVTDVQMSVKDKKREYGGFANCIPALRQWLDYPHIASIACPKPMLFINGTRDHLFPVDGTHSAFSTMHDVWRSQNVDSALETELWDVPHSCGKALQQRSLEFFNKRFGK
ncbi:MAG: prolyl oligopeptidase family serine peptidase [Prevotella sp.]|nr:prolyl oligopeptidase family serine peptidase [Prevotella sp.]